MRKLVVAVGLLAVAACGGSQKKTETGGATKGLGVSGEIEGAGDLKIPTVDPAICDTKDKEVVQYDLDRDDRPDVWKLFKRQSEKGATVQALTCKQVDLDHDGRKDYVVHYDDSGAMVAEEYDFDFDGRFDARYHYDKRTSRRYLVERDTSFDNKPDWWEKYDGAEQLESIRRDRNADGRPDYWEQYKEGGLEAILYDDDFDGKVDRQDRATAKAAPAPASSPAPASPPAGAPTPAPAPTPGPAPSST